MPGRRLPVLNQTSVQHVNLMILAGKPLELRYSLLNKGWGTVRCILGFLVVAAPLIVFILLNTPRDTWTVLILRCLALLILAVGSVYLYGVFHNVRDLSNRSIQLVIDQHGIHDFRVPHGMFAWHEIETLDGAVTARDSWQTVLRLNMHPILETPSCEFSTSGLDESPEYIHEFARAAREAWGRT